MSDKVRTVIEPIDGGKSDDLSDSNGSGGNTGGIENAPIIDFGTDRIEPSTYRIPDAPASGTRRNRHGGIDGRSRAARAARAAGTGETAPPNQQNLASVISLKELLLTVHNSASMLLKIEELALENEEAEKLSKAIEDLAKFYPVAIDPKKLAWANLGITAAQIYGLRIMAYRLRMANEKGVRGQGSGVREHKSTPTPVTEMPKPTPQAEIYNPSDVWNESAEIV